jgi:NUMOD4 motif
MREMAVAEYVEQQRGHVEKRQSGSVTWLPIPAYPGYWISSDGRVRHHGRELVAGYRKG